jgi:hypothetical protein
MYCINFKTNFIQKSSISKRNKAKIPQILKFDKHLGILQFKSPQITRTDFTSKFDLTILLRTYFSNSSSIFRFFELLNFLSFFAIVRLNWITQVWTCKQSQRLNRPSSDFLAFVFSSTHTKKIFSQLPIYRYHKKEIQKSILPNFFLRKTKIFSVFRYLAWPFYIKGIIF